VIEALQEGTADLDDMAVDVGSGPVVEVRVRLKLKASATGDDIPEETIVGAYG
jgi:hypothetical protein